MGIITSRDTRRISFDNTFASSCALAIPKANEDIIGFDDLAHETRRDSIFDEKTKHLETAEEGETGYWVQRIDSLKREHQVINKIIETEYDRQVQITNSAYEPPKVITDARLLKIKPCLDWRSKIKQCYEENPRQPLVCSPYVQEFVKCVASCRAND